MSEEVKKLITRTIQPMRDGKPVGQPHKYEGATEQEVMDKMAEAIANGTLKINELTRKVMLEPSEKPAPIEGAEVDTPRPVFKPRELTPTEKVELAINLRDPDKVDEAFDRLYEARTGRKPADDAKVQEETYDNARLTRERAESQAFLDAHPEYYPSAKNLQAFVDYMTKHNLAWRKKNLDIAYKEMLASDGLLDTAPPVESNPADEVPTPRTEEPRTEAHEQEPARKPTAFPSGLTRSDATGAPNAKKKGPSPQEFAMMTADQKKDYYISIGKWGK